jgi:hypothetical protein
MREFTDPTNILLSILLPLKVQLKGFLGGTANLEPWHFLNLKAGKLEALMGTGIEEIFA